MSVTELIRRLSTLPEDYEVVCKNGDWEINDGGEILNVFNDSQQKQVVIRAELLTECPDIEVEEK